MFVEQLRAKAINDGLQLNFRVRVDQKKNKNSDIMALEKCIFGQIESGELSKSIQKCWKLYDGVTIRNVNVTEKTQNEEVELLETNTPNAIEDADDEKAAETHETLR